jgi:hypothetical protein
MASARERGEAGARNRRAAFHVRKAAPTSQLASVADTESALASSRYRAEARRQRVPPGVHHGWTVPSSFTNPGEGFSPSAKRTMARRRILRQEGPSKFATGVRIHPGWTQNPKTRGARGFENARLHVERAFDMQ